MSAYSLPKYAEFIRSIREAPDDDLPRMVCSDWLEEQGEAERAEFIRCQVEKSRLERESGGKLPVKEVIDDFDRRLTPNAVGRQTVEMRTGNFKPQLAVGNIATLKRRTGAAIRGDWRVHWIEQRGRAYARFWHTEFEQAPPCPLRDRWRELAKLEGELLPYQWCWPAVVRVGQPCELMIDTAPGSAFQQKGTIEATYSRGFLESIRIRGADWITHADEIVKRNPVRKVVIVGNWPIADFASPWTQERYKRELKHKDYPGIEFTFEREEYSYSVAREERFFTAADG